MAIIFTHIPKCGGTTFRNILENVYDNVYLLYPPDIETKISKIESLNSEKLAGIDLIAGHVGFGINRKLKFNVPRHYITMLRDPAERVISYYNHCKTYSNTNISEYIKDLSLEEFIEGEFKNPVENYQTRFLSGIPNLDTCNNNTLKVAISNLEKYYSTWGIMESFQESLILFQDKLKWDKIPPYRTLNTAKRNIDVNPKTLQRIKEKNKLDYELYAFAKSRLEESFEEVKDKTQKLKFLNVRIQSYSKGYMDGKNETSAIIRKDPTLKQMVRIFGKKVRKKFG